MEGNKRVRRRRRNTVERLKNLLILLLTLSGPGADVQRAGG